MLFSAGPMSKIGKYEALERLIDDAWDTAQRLDLEMVKFLLEMAKLELYQEIQTVISSSAVLRHGTGHNTLPAAVNTEC
jgi:hypothetical protein